MLRKNTLRISTLDICSKALACHLVYRQTWLMSRVRLDGKLAVLDHNEMFPNEALKTVQNKLPAKERTSA